MLQEALHVIVWVLTWKGYLNKLTRERIELAISIFSYNTEPQINIPTKPNVYAYELRHLFIFVIKK